MIQARTISEYQLRLLFSADQNGHLFAQPHEEEQCQELVEYGFLINIASRFFKPTEALKKFFDARENDQLN